MLIRATETVTIVQAGNAPTIPGYTLSDWKNLIAVGIQRNVTTGRNLYDWDYHEQNKASFGNAWKKVPGHPEHEVDRNKIQYHTYQHGGRTELQAVYFFEV